MSKLYIETHGCQMNEYDSSRMGQLLSESHGLQVTDDPAEADVILLNTCAIRDNAEQRIRERLKHLRANKKQNRDLIIGVLGCMAERLKDKLLEEEYHLGSAPPAAAMALSILTEDTP